MDNRVPLFRFVLGIIIKLLLHAIRLSFTLQLYEDEDENVKYAGLAIFYLVCHFLWLLLILVNYYDWEKFTIWLPAITFVLSTVTTSFDILILVAFIQARFKTDFYAMIVFWTADTAMMVLIIIFSLQIITRKWLFLKVIYQYGRLFWTKYIRKSEGKQSNRGNKCETFRCTRNSYGTVRQATLC